MTVLIIRAHKRFGVCRKVTLRGRDNRVAHGLLIEMSQEGCRISNVSSEAFAFEEQVTVEVDGWEPFCGRVRWHHGGIVGLRLTEALHRGELAQFIDFCRAVPGMIKACQA